jgi:hypothetical protein
VIDQVQLVVAQILGAGRIRRAPEVGGELAHGATLRSSSWGSVSTSNSQLFPPSISGDLQSTRTCSVRE